MEETDNTNEINVEDPNYTLSAWIDDVDIDYMITIGMVTFQIDNKQSVKNIAQLVNQFVDLIENQDEKEATKSNNNTEVKESNYNLYAWTSRDDHFIHIGLVDILIKAESLKNVAKLLNRFSDLVEKQEDFEEKMRSEQEIQDAEHEFFEKVWYGRSDPDRIEEGEIKEAAIKAKAKILKKYGKNNLPYEPFEWGMTTGKLSALRWVLGSEWDFLDT